MRRRVRDERGQVTAEYAIGTLGAATVAAGVLLGPGSVVPEWIGRLVLRTFERAFQLNLPDLVRWPW